MTTIAIGSDHAGFELKSALKVWLSQNGYQVDDVGTFSDERADYPQFGSAVGQAVASGSAAFGVVVCGSGQGLVAVFGGGHHGVWLWKGMTVAAVDAGGWDEGGFRDYLSTSM